MTRQPLLLTAALMALTMACGETSEPAESADPGAEAPAGNPGGKADSYYACGGVEYPDESDYPGHDTTSRRVRALTDYANALLACTQPDLDATFERRRIEARPIAEAYAIRVEGDDCFTERSRWGWDDDLKSDDDLEAMQQQVRSTVSFLRNFHEDFSGYPNRLFDTVVLCPEGVVGEPLSLEGRRLYVAPGQGLLGGWATLEAQEIREAWSDGVHLKKRFGLLAKLWFALDPVGTPRIALRAAMGEAVDYVAEQLDSTKEAPEEVLRSELIRLVRTHTLEGYQAEGAEGEDEPSFQETAVEDIEQMSEDDLRTLAEVWAEQLTDQDERMAMDQAAAGLHEASARNAINLDVQQIGLFAFANFHDINVNADFLFPSQRRLLRYIRIEQVDWDVKVRQYALISIWTSDNVNVNVSVQVDRALETASLEKALAGLR